MVAARIFDLTSNSGRGQRLAVALGTVLAVTLAGTAGFMFAEHLPLLDALYLTLGLMSTSGGFERPHTLAGRVLAVSVLILGVAALFYTLGTLMEYMIEGHFTQAIWRRRMDHRIERLRGHAIICGFGRVGRQIAHEFTAAGQALVVIDPAGANAELLRELGYLYVQGDATTDEKLLEAGIGHARILLAATDADTENIAITLSARAVAPHLWIIARANHDEAEPKLRRAGADRVLSPYRLGGHRMAELARRPHLADFLDAALEGAGVGLSFIQVDEGSPWLGVHLPVTDSNTLPAPFRGSTIVAMCPVGEERWMGVRAGPRRELTVGDGLVILGPQPAARPAKTE